MANQPPNQPSSQPAGQSTGQPPQRAAAVTGTVAGVRTAGVRPCPSCDAWVNVHATICPNCGENVAAKEKSVRCRRCRHRASSNLVLCPHCGRELQPALSRWITWGLPLLLMLLLGGAVLVRAARSDPASWMQTQSERAGRLIAALGSRLQPDVSVVMIPAGQDPNDPLVSQAAQAGNFAPVNQEDIVLPAPDAAAPLTDTEMAAATAAEGAAQAVVETAAVAPAEAAPVADTPTAAPPENTATATAAPTDTPTDMPTATAAASATPLPTATAAATATGTTPATATPRATATRFAKAGAAVAAAASPALSRTVSLLGLVTATPTEEPATATPTATPEPVLEVYRVRAGDTLSEIATAYDVTVDDLLVTNDLTEEDVYTIQPGDDLRIPAPTPEGAPTATPRPGPASYTVRAGDTLLAISLRQGVTVEDLLAANGLTINDARRLQPGAVLLLPGAEELATPTPETTSTGATPTATEPATATPVAPPTETPRPQIVLRLDAPQLRAPENGAAVSCSGQGTLTWLPVLAARPSDLYIVHLGYVNSVGNDKSEDVIWVIAQPRPMSTTSWPLDNDLCGLAPSTAGKQWRWYVEVVEKTADGTQPVSPASSIWGFAWQ